MKRTHHVMLIATIILSSLLSEPKFLPREAQKEQFQVNTSQLIAISHKDENQERDTSKLPKALLGHWVSEPFDTQQTKQKQMTHLYFSQKDFGIAVEIDGKLIPDKSAKYKIIKVDEEKNQLRLEYKHPHENKKLEQTLKFSPDRQTMRQILHSQNKVDIEMPINFFYVDSQQSP
jgi:hypothetical protein